MNTFYVEIIASNGVYFKGKVNAVIFPTIDGEVEFMAFHEDVTEAVDVGVLRVQHDDGVWHRAVISEGVAQFVHNRCRILVDTCEKPEDIDRARAEAAAERAKEQLRQKKSIEEYKIAQGSLARALTRLKETYKD